MLDALLLTAAVVASTCGMAWLALGMKGHWQQVRGDAVQHTGTVRVLRVLGATALVASLWLCLRADHASMAILVWVMALAGSALAVAFTLTWRPHWLAWLVIWSRA